MSFGLGADESIDIVSPLDIPFTSNLHVPFPTRLVDSSNAVYGRGHHRAANRSDGVIPLLQTEGPAIQDRRDHRRRSEYGTLEDN